MKIRESKKGIEFGIILSIVIILVLLGILLPTIRDNFDDLDRSLADMQSCGVGTASAGGYCKYSCDELIDSGDWFKGGNLCGKEEGMFCCFPKEDVKKTSLAYFNAFVEDFRRCDVSERSCYDASVIFQQILGNEGAKIKLEVQGNDATKIIYILEDTEMQRADVDFGMSRCFIRKTFWSSEQSSISSINTEFFLDYSGDGITAEDSSEDYDGYFFSNFNRMDDGKICAVFGRAK